MSDKHALILLPEDVWLIAQEMKTLLRDPDVYVRPLEFGDGFWMYLRMFRVAVAKYPFKEQYGLRVWSHEDDILVAQIDGFQNLPELAEVHQLMAGRRLSKSDGAIRAWLLCDLGEIIKRWPGQATPMAPSGGQGGGR